MHFPFFILAFDHRSGFAKDVLGGVYPPSDADKARGQELKQVIFEAFKNVRQQLPADQSLGLLVDEEFGQAIIDEARAEGLPFAVPVEASGSASFEFEHKNHFDERLNELRPTYAKALVRYSLGDEPNNAKQRAELKKLADFCAPNGVPLMLEVLLGQKENSASSLKAMIGELQAAGIQPALWKLEGLTLGDDWQGVAEVAQAPIVVLGRGENRQVVEKWISEAARSGVVDGFAIGRTIFLEPIKQLAQGKIGREEARDRIAKNYLAFISLWQKYA